jgi:hypothetical protein
VAGSVGQLQFNPYAFPDRAQREEFGDLLAEGLFDLLHAGITDPLVADESYWADVIEARARMIRSVRARLHASTGPRASATPAQRRRIAQASRSLAAAAGVHAERAQLAESLASYVRAWRADLSRWHEWFAALDQVDDVGGAIKLLNIPAERLTAL